MLSIASAVARSCASLPAWFKNHVLYPIGGVRARPLLSAAASGAVATAAAAAAAAAANAAAAAPRRRRRRHAGLGGARALEAAGCAIAEREAAVCLQLAMSVGRKAEPWIEARLRWKWPQ